MFKNYFKTAVRSLLRNKGYSILNIAGLAIGMASAILILLWISNEVSMDRSYTKSDRLYILNNRDKDRNGNIWMWNWTPKIMGPVVANDYPEVEEMSRYSTNEFLFTVGENKSVIGGGFVDPGFLNILDFPLIKGNPMTALNAINKIVITEKMAKKLFGNEDAMGKTVKIDSSNLFTVSGVLKDLPSNTTFNFEWLLPMSYYTRLYGDNDNSWYNNTGQTYISLKAGSDLQVFNRKIKNITLEHTKGSGDPSVREVFAYPLSKTYLYSKVENGKYVAGRATTVRMFVSIAILILLIACINFMNLSTARSEKRAKEVGVRKVVGAKKISLIFQFLIESLFLAFLAFLLAITLVMLVLPFFDTLVGKTLAIPFHNINFWIGSLVFIFLTGLLAGSYPAFFLSSFNPVKVLKGSFKKAQYTINPRSVLVVIQFTFAIVLIISTIIIGKQIHFIQSRDQGYNQDAVVYTTINGDIAKNYSLIRQELLNSGAVLSITKTMSPITEQWSDGSGYTWPGATLDDKKLDFGRFSTDADMTKTLGIKIVQGRDIDIYHYPTDSSALLLNESAVKEMRLKNPIGVELTDGYSKWRILGVVKDFILNSPAATVGAIMIQGPNSWFNCIHYRLNANRPVAENLQKIGDIFKKYNPAYPFEYKFVDESYAKKFEDIERLGKLTTLFSALTIFISCLGLFGLAAFMAEVRTKEIGVRKILGASISQITVLVSRDFIKLVIIALLIAIPIAWYASHQWLLNYEYRISIPIVIFFIAGILSISIAIFTVGFLALRAAKANPAKSLRTE